RRNDRSLSIEELAEQSGLTEEQITLFETGQSAIPLPQLEILADLLVFRVEDLFDQHGPIGQWRAEQEATRELAEMPPHLKAFVLKPVNRPYIELAMRLNDLSVEKLRSIAEGLLEITY
ncbi:MAG: helix-turn-helix transcriptional regulator, partial [Anaerolineaceae bacterium]